MYSASFIILGCKVNTFESNAIMNDFEAGGFKINKQFDVSDVYVINTCTVTNQADVKSRKMIRHAKKLNPNAVVVVMGCYSQINSKQTIKMPEVDIVLGNNNKHLALPYVLEELKERKKILDVKKTTEFSSYELIHAKTFEHTRAFLKIEEGCQNFCSYCIIPYARGPVRSMNSDAVIKDLIEITENGYKEVVLTGIHVGAYYSNKLRLSGLIREIFEKVPKLKRLRLSSIEIVEIDDELIKIIEEKNIFADHLHLPLQSGCDKILKLMNRHYDSAKFADYVNRIRAVNPDISITTDVIVGFPYETEEDFLTTYKFIEDINFSELHVFPFSKRNNTKAAEYPDINGSIKKDRVHRLIKLSDKLNLEYMKKFVGKEMDIIVETTELEGLMVGHTSNYLKVYCPFDESLLTKQVLVKINEEKDGKLYGSVIKEI